MLPDQRKPRYVARRPSARWASGFTLTELMVTVAVLAIVATIAAPNFSNLLNSNRLTASANDVVAALQTARMEAVRRNSTVSLCPSTNGAGCAGDAWQRFIVFADEDADGTVDDADTVIRDVALSTGGINVSASSNVSGNDRISFGANGFARMGGARSGALSVCSTKLPAAENTRDVVVEVSRIGVSRRNGSSACSARTDP